MTGHLDSGPVSGQEFPAAEVLLDGAVDPRGGLLFLQQSPAVEDLLDGAVDPLGGLETVQQSPAADGGLPSAVCLGDGLVLARQSPAAEVVLGDVWLLQDVLVSDPRHHVACFDNVAADHRGGGQIFVHRSLLDVLQLPSLHWPKILTAHAS